MGRPPKVPGLAWELWLKMIDSIGYGAWVSAERWREIAYAHLDTETRQGVDAYRTWLVENGFVEPVWGGFRVSQGYMDHSTVTEAGLFSQKPGGETVQVLDDEEVRELGLWEDDRGENPGWDQVANFSFPTRDVPGLGAFIEKKAEYMRTQIQDKTRLLDLDAGPPSDPTRIDYLEDIHHHFLNSLGYEIGDEVPLEDWRVILAYDYQSVIWPDYAAEYHDSRPLEVFTEMTRLAELLGLVRVQDDAVILMKAPRKTLDQPRLKPSKRNLWRDPP